MKLASISELKDGLSAHIDLVRAGETVVVTDRRVPVAMIERIAPGILADDEVSLVAAGIVAPRRGRLEVDRFLGLPKGVCGGGLSAAVHEEREGGR